MAEKAIIGKMSLYETLTMIVPGTMIAFSIWLLNPQYWMHFLDKAGYTTNVNYLYDIALILLMFALVYVAGLINYLLIDGIWRFLGLRNNTCMIKNVLNIKISSHKYNNLAQLNKDDIDICKIGSDKIEDIYYEAYTYAIKKNGRSNIPYLENQVAMLKGLIFPISWIVYQLCQEEWYKWLVVSGIVIILIALTISRQKKTITLVLEDYEYEKRIAQQQ